MSTSCTLRAYVPAFLAACTCAVVTTACSDDGGREPGGDEARAVDDGKRDSPRDAGLADVDARPIEADAASVERDAARPGDASGEGDGDAPGCVDGEIALIVDQTGGDSLQYYAAIEVDGEPRLFQVDTGSSLTFEFLGEGSPDYVPDSSVATIGCERIAIAGREFTSHQGLIAGSAVTGIIGMDFFLSAPTVLDLDPERPSIVRSRDRVSELIGREGAFAVAFDRVQGHALVPLTIDGVRVRLMLDTGAAHSMHVGVEGRLEDDVYYVQDAQGTVFPVWRGDASLIYPGRVPLEVPIERVLEFPYFEVTVELLGGDLHGLLGVSSLQGGLVVFETSADRFWSVPRL